MEFICQLGNGYMLALDSDCYKKVQTGYPYPDIDGGQIQKLMDVFDFTSESLYSAIVSGINNKFQTNETISIDSDSMHTFINSLKHSVCINYEDIMLDLANKLFIYKVRNLDKALFINDFKVAFNSFSRFEYHDDILFLNAYKSVNISDLKDFFNKYPIFDNIYILENVTSELDSYSDYNYVVLSESIDWYSIYYFYFDVYLYYVF